MIFSRFRSLSRDQDTDTARLTKVRACIAEALGGIELETSGLRRRIERVTTNISLAMGTEDGYYEPREPAQERELARAERELGAATARLRQLETQAHTLRKAQQTLDAL